MKNGTNIIAIDLGAESGRVILGTISDLKLEIRELHRFSNIPVRLNDGIHWDILRLWNDILDGLTIAGKQANGKLSCLGLDTWGVDYGLLDKKGSLIMNPFHYRDSRTDGMLDLAFSKMSKKKIFFDTGIQFMQLNTLYQLLSMVQVGSPVLEIADTFLTMPDLFNYWFTGEKVSEFSIATTTQCYNPNTHDWAGTVLAAMNIPHHLFPPIVHPGKDLGVINNWVSERVGYSDIKVIAPACHDTGSAVAAVPSKDDNYAWISSGTWSIMGINLNEPVINEQSLEYNFTNEGGVGNTFRFSKNIMGLWLIQECRRTWQSQGKDYSYTQLTELASNAPEQNSIIDVDYVDFLKPGDMPKRIRKYLLESNQVIPEDDGSITRVILESIALKYRWVLDKLEHQTGKKIDTIHMIGGGIQNILLNQLTADATNRKIVAGPIEATAIGNILTQAISLGLYKSFDEAREVIHHSFTPTVYLPAYNANWDEKYEKLMELLR